jgi:hypothetical protein
VRPLAILLAVTVAALPPAAAGQESDVPRQVDLELGAPAPFKGTLVNRARAEEIAKASPTVTCETDKKACEFELEAWKVKAQEAPPGGVAVGTVAGVVIVVGVVSLAVGVVAGAYLFAQASK